MRCSSCNGNGEDRGLDGQTRRMCCRCGGTGEAPAWLEFGCLIAFAIVVLGPLFSLYLGVVLVGFLAP
jgi:hypothetical protein